MIARLRRMHPAGRAALVGLLVATLFLPLAAGAVDCETELAEAEQYYRKGRFDEAIALIDACLGKPEVPQDVRSRAYRLIGLTYLAQDYRDKAKLAVVDLLRLVPDYACDPQQDPPTFCNLLDEERGRALPASSAQAEDKGRSAWRKWLLIAGGGLIAGGLLALASSSDDAPADAGGPIAEPPALPASD